MKLRLTGLAKVSLRATCLPGFGGWLWLQPSFPLEQEGQIFLSWQRLGSLSEGGHHPISLLSHLQQLEALTECISFCYGFFFLFVFFKVLGAKGTHSKRKQRNMSFPAWVSQLNSVPSWIGTLPVLSFSPCTVRAEETGAQRSEVTCQRSHSQGSRL